jgi:hypothetical protein
MPSLEDVALLVGYAAYEHCPPVALVPVTLDPSAHLEAVEDAGHGGEVHPDTTGESGRADRAVVYENSRSPRP